MEIRELVRLKNGLGGLEQPLNLGILLDRDKAGKDHLAVVFTLKGTLRVKWKFIKESSGHVYQGSKEDERSMTDFLTQTFYGNTIAPWAA